MDTETKCVGCGNEYDEKDVMIVSGVGPMCFSCLEKATQRYMETKTPENEKKSCVQCKELCDDDEFLYVTGMGPMCEVCLIKIAQEHAILKTRDLTEEQAQELWDKMEDYVYAARDSSAEQASESYDDLELLKLEGDEQVRRVELIQTFGRLLHFRPRAEKLWHAETLFRKNAISWLKIPK